MRTVVFLLALGLAAIEAVPTNPERIVGGSQTNISNYPNLAGLLYSGNLVTYNHACGGSIINARSILTAAHCIVGDPVHRWRIRVGSTMANSAGVVHVADRIVTHTAYNFGVRWNNDIGIIRSATAFTFNNFVRVSIFAGTNYNLPDNVSVWTAGWGITSLGGTKPEHLRHVELFTVPQFLCRESYGSSLTENMLCAGNFFLGGVSPCDGDSGGPLLRSGVVVGIVSWGRGCGQARTPGVFTRVSLYRNWITNNI